MGIDLAAIRERLGKAISAPWMVYKNEVLTQKEDQEGYKTQICKLTPCKIAPHNAEFIAHAPEDIEALLNEVERLRGIETAARDYVSALDNVVKKPSEWAKKEKALRQALEGAPSDE